MRLLAFVLIFLGLAACASEPTPEPLKIGNKVDFAQLQDQWANPFPHEDAMELLLYTDSMSASRDVREAMDRIKPECYQQGRVVFVANISGMPSLISRFIAVPKMRGYPYPVWLDYEGNATSALPVQDDAVSFVKVNQGEIQSVEYAHGMEEVLNVLTPMCGLKPEQVAAK